MTRAGGDDPYAVLMRWPGKLTRPLCRTTYAQEGSNITDPALSPSP